MLKQRSSTPISRRTLLVGAGAAAAVACLPGRGFSQSATSNMSVQLSWLETGDYAALFAAEKEGFDKALGLKQNFVPGGPQIDPIQAVAGGSAPVGICSNVGIAALARANGIPVKLLGAFFRRSPAGLISLADNPILKPQDAVGKRIAIQSTARLAWSIILREHGLTEDQMTIIPAGPDISPLVTKQVDGYWGLATNQHLALKQRGIENHIMLRDQVGAPEHFNLIFSTEAAIASQPDLIRNWLRVALKGAAFVPEHVDEIGQYVVDRSPKLRLDAAQQKGLIREGLKFGASPEGALKWLQIDQVNAQKAIEQLRQQGKLPATITYDDLVFPSLLEEARV